MSPAAKTYYPYLDKLRVFLTCLVIFHHTAIAFGASGGWYYKSPDLWSGWSERLMSLVMGIDQSYFMALFFFISAWLMPASYERKGAMAFVRDRLVRLGVPLLVFILVLNPALVGIIRFYKGVPVDWVQVFLHNHCPGPMWFVLTLLVFELLYVVYRSCRKTVPKISAATKLPSVWTVVAFIVVMGLVAFAIRLVCPAGKSWFGLQFGYFPLYVGMFCAGIVAWRDGWLERMQVRNALGWFGLAWGAIVAFVAFYFVNRSSGDSDSGGWNRMAFAYAMWEPILCVGFSYFLLAAFKRWGNEADRFFRALAADSYMTYVLHPFFVVGATFLAQCRGMGPWVGAAFVCVAAIVTGFGAAHLIRRIPARLTGPVRRTRDVSRGRNCTRSANPWRDRGGSPGTVRKGRPDRNSPQVRRNRKKWNKIGAEYCFLWGNSYICTIFYAMGWGTVSPPFC